MTTTPARQYQRRRTAAQWAAENPVLAAGEIGVASDSTHGGSTGNAFKIGNGTAAWNSLFLNTPTIGFSLGVNAMDSTATVTRTNGFPRLVFPDAATTDAYITLGLPAFWSAVTIGFDWSNDHSTTGDVRWQFTFRGNDVGSTMSSPEMNNVVTSTIGTPAAGAHTTSLMQTDLAITHGGFGTLWALQMTRLGSDAADTLAGAVGLMEVVINRSGT